MTRILKFLGAALTFLGLILIIILFAAIFYTDFSSPTDRNRFIFQSLAVAVILAVGILLARLRLPAQTNGK